MNYLSLNGSWEMNKKNDSTAIQASVPGSVYNDLINSNLLDDPFYRDNEFDALKISGNDYEYSRNFEISDEILQSDVVYLLCMLL